MPRCARTPASWPPGLGRRAALAEHVERVFEAFYTTKSSGVGMGLSICRSIIDAHGGRLWAEANEPRGAVFQFTLPGVEGDQGVRENGDSRPERESPEVRPLRIADAGTR